VVKQTNIGVLLLVALANSQTLGKKESIGAYCPACYNFYAASSNVIYYFFKQLKPGRFW
jgi:hypothetical protein